VTDGNGCVTLPGTSILVVEIPTPVADAGPDLEVCSATDITIGTVAVAGQTYSWNPAAGLDNSLVAQPVANVSNNSGADIVFNYEVTASAAQCNAVDQMNLTVHFVPLVDAGTADSLCFGDNMMLSATGAATYLWEDNGYFNDPLDSQAPVVTPTASSWFVVTGFDALLCSAMDSVFIEVPEQLVVEEDYTASVCFGFCDGTIDLVATGGFEPYTVQWTGGLPANFNLTNLCPGTFDYVVTDDFGCEETGTIAITEWGINFVDDVIVSNPLCYGDNNGAIEVVEPGALSYAIIETAETNTTGVFDTLAAGGYSIQIIDANGCAADTAVSLVELSSEILLDPAFDDIQVCYQDVVDFSGAAAGGFGLLTYTWYNCPELVAACELGTGSPYTVVVTQDTTLYCVATDVNGCVSNVAALSAHFNAPIVLSLDPSGSASVCEFDCINLEVGATGGDGSVDVSWFVIDSGAIVEVDDSYTTSQCPLVNTMYYVTGDDGCNPTVTDSVYVTVLDTPEAIIDVIGGEGCYPLTVEFVNLTEAELADSCVWDMDDGNTQPICSGFEYTYADEGVYYPWISVTSPDGCTDLDTLDVPIIVHGYPTADFTWEPQPVTVLENQVYFFDQSEGAVEWDWDFAGLGSSVFP
ncbi:MAG: SprB repeat-containing protein, partial [Flavobacteriales bacterium]|nr:SprB repeat-containing protein [Flavobacteriales bacterium]